MMFICVFLVVRLLLQVFLYTSFLAQKYALFISLAGIVYEKAFPARFIANSELSLSVQLEISSLLRFVNVYSHRINCMQL